MKLKNDALWKCSRDELALKIEENYLCFVGNLSEKDRISAPYSKVVEAVHKRLEHIRGGHFTPSASATTELVRNTLSPCAFAIGVVVADAFSVLFQFCGVNEFEARAATRALLEEMGEDTLRGLMANIHDLANAATLEQQAKEVWKLLAATSNAIGISAIVNALRSTMNWWDWVLASITVTAQLTAWFASDGAALIAELMLGSAFVVQLVIDAIAAADICNQSALNHPGNRGGWLV